MSQPSNSPDGGPEASGIPTPPPPPASTPSTPTTRPRDLSAFKEQVSGFGSSGVLPSPAKETAIPDGADSDVQPSQLSQHAAPRVAQDHLREIYYDDLNGAFRVQDDRGDWIQMRGSDLERYLQVQGVPGRTGKKGELSPVDRLITKIQLHHAVSYIGPLAGYEKGEHEVCGKRILVTESPTLIEPTKGDWPTLHHILDGMLLDGDVDQRPYFYGWLKVAITAFRAGTRRPGQALVLAGPRDGGKSVLQNYVITPLLGGRGARPYQFMTGGTSFNSDMFAAEHLMVEDEAASTDLRARRHFGALLKQITATDASRCHAKYAKPVMLTPFWRLSITVNDEPENLMVLPPLDESLLDKLILLRAQRQVMPMPTQTHEEREAFTTRLREELPHFLEFLLAWEIPAELRGPRYGITHFHHPDLMAAIDDLAPEHRLLTIIDRELFSRDGVEILEGEPWEGTAEELERKLTNSGSSSRQELQRLLTFNTACGVFLGRLAKKRLNRVSERRVHGIRYWTIQPPSERGGAGAPSAPTSPPAPPSAASGVQGC